MAAIFTTGGTGLAPRDVTPEATRAVLDREIPGFGELMRARGRESTPLAVLSRSLAGTRGQCADRQSAGIAEGRCRIPGCYRGIGAARARTAPRADGTRCCPAGVECFDSFSRRFSADCSRPSRPLHRRPTPISNRSPRPFVVTASITCRRPRWVYDRDGNTISGLRPDQFRLFDNGKEQNIQVDVSFTPISLVICLQANSHVQQFMPQLRKLGNLVKPLLIGDQGEAAVISYHGERQHTCRISPPTRIRSRWRRRRSSPARIRTA